MNYKQIIIVILLIISVIGCKRDNQSTYELPLVSLDKNKEFRGSFFLGTGSFGNQNYYYMITEEPGGGYYERNISTCISLLFETDGNPKIVFSGFIRYFDNGISQYERPASFNKYDNGTIKIYIPKNSIIRKYDPNNH